MVTPEERLKILEEVFTALTRCPIHRLARVTQATDERPAETILLAGFGMNREDLSSALASLNGGVIPMPRD